jgi:DNA-binding NarL/FixJ family response regulator
MSVDVSAHMVAPAGQSAQANAFVDQNITRRELEVLEAIADGLTPAEVASRLFISHSTVKNHLSAIYHKLEARDRTQAVIRAVRLGIVRLREEDRA